MEHADRVVSRRFQSEGDAILLLGGDAVTLGASEYLKVVCGLVRGVPPSIDLDRERSLQALLVDLATARLVRSAHDCSDGGLAVTLAECCFDTNGMGAEIAVDGVNLSPDPATNRAAALFGESASRVVASSPVDSVSRVLERAAAAGVPARVVGRTGGARLRVAVGGVMAVDLSIGDAERTWSSAVERHFEKRVA